MRSRSLLSGLAAMLAVATVVAIVPPAASRDRDHDRRDEVRRAVEAGDIKSLTDILNTVRNQLPGEVAGVEVERKNGNWLYEFRVVGANGRLFDVYVDARSGTIVRTKEK